MKLSNRYILLINAIVFVILGLTTAALASAVLFDLFLLCYRYRTVISCYLIFAYNCFLKPLVDIGKFKSSDSHQTRLETFYEGQSAIYDETRMKLLRGRSSMLHMSAGHLGGVYKTIFNDSEATSDKKVVWIDLGGGTGWNIEHMNTIITISRFHAVYLIDITPSLCEVARERFTTLGWKNVTVICQDALQYQLPSFAPDVDVGLITLSYSCKLACWSDMANLVVSMMPQPFPIVDRVSEWLSETGFVGVADFYTSEKLADRSDKTRQHSFFTRWFWQLWFETDGVYLHPFRRMYLEHKFETVKSFNCRNWIIKNVFGMPYYIWLGRKRPVIPAVAVSAAEVATAQLVEGQESQPLEVAKATKDAGQKKHWREPYSETALHDLDRYIYAFTWEDPVVDIQVLDIRPDDNILLLTSGGCNALEYAIQGPERIHAVDMNPCQGHMLELKLAAIKTMSHTDAFRLFGLGYHHRFKQLLDVQLGPRMSSDAYSFWKRNADFGNLYETGSSGLAIKAFRFLIWAKGLNGHIERLCRASSIPEQVKIWETNVRKHLLGKRWITLLNSYKFAWDALGVPKAQFEMLLREGTAYDYIVNTIDPLVQTTLLSHNQYFYHVCLRRAYAGSNVGECPGYLTQNGFEHLKSSRNLDAFTIHTDSILNVLNTKISSPGSAVSSGMHKALTKAVLMDHLDWFTPQQAHDEIGALAKKIIRGGKVLLRSSSKKPWYLQIFVRNDFRPVPIGVRLSEREAEMDLWKIWVKSELDPQHANVVKPCIDRVNMYASCWLLIKN